MKKILFIIIIIVSFWSCNSNSGINKIKLDYLYYRALNSDSLSDYNSSIQYYNQMLKIDSVNVNALVNRGKALIHISKIQEGFKDINKAIKYNPNENTYYARCNAYLYLNNYDSAEIDLKKVKEYYPPFPNYYYKLSKLQMLKGDYFHALVYCEIADEHNLNLKLSNSIKAELSTKLDKDIVANYNYKKMSKIILELPIINKASYKMAKLDSLINEVYFFKVEAGDSIMKKYTFRMDAKTLKVLNPEGY